MEQRLRVLRNGTKSEKTSRLFRAFPAIGLVTILCLGTARAVPPSDWQSHVSPELRRVYEDAAATSAMPSAAASSAPSKAHAHIDSQGRVQVDVQFDCVVKAPVRALAAAGLVVSTTVKMPPTCVVEGWIAPRSLPQITAVPGVIHLKLPVYASHRPREFPTPPVPKNPQSPPRAATGTQARDRMAVPQAMGGPVIDGTGVAILRADQYISQTSVNGAGITVGVMSDDAASLALIQSRGELSSVTIVPSSTNPAPTDEGTMMLEEVHAIAPGAGLAFCGPQTEVEYLNCLTGFSAAGATILVDDLAIHDEDLMSASSVFQQSVQNFLAANPWILLFTVTDNYNGSYWEGGYVPVSLASLGYAPLTCTVNGVTQTDYYVNNSSGTIGQTLTVNVAQSYALLFQWADPFGQNASNFDLYWVDTVTNQQGCISAAGSTNTFFGPSAALSADNYYMVVATPDQSLAGKFMKFFVGGNGLTALAPSTGGSVVTAQAYVSGVVSVGAVNGSDGIGNTIEPFSGRGPINIAFPTPSALQAPHLVATDNVYVDAIGTNFQSETTPAGNFVGTSAAAPNAAAVAALIRSAFPMLTPAQLTGYLQTGSMQLGGAVPDYTFGYGRVDALGALSAIPYPTLSGWPNSTIVGGSSSAAYSFTVSGVGNLHFYIHSNNSALLPASLVSAGTAGVTISPSSCGASTTACTISFTPAIGKAGVASVTVFDADGANRWASITSTITVTKPAPPAVSVTSGGSQSITAGSGASPVAFSVAGTGSLSMSVSSSNAALLPNSSIVLSAGCGTTSKSCTATLTLASGQSGTADVTIQAQDPYGQAGTATASVQVAAPPSKSGGGGGALDVWGLVSLAGLLTVRVRRGLRQRSGRAPPQHCSEDLCLKTF